MSIGHHPDSGQHTPDMRKADSEITSEQREEAKRRIEGSLNSGGGENVGPVVAG